MATTSSTHTIAGIALPRSVCWVDEFEWTAPQRAQEYSITGALIVDVGVRLAGRPITLKSDADHGWVTRAVVQQLQAAINTSAGPVLLQLADGRSMNVHFAPDPLQATPLVRAELPGPELPYLITLRLIAA